MPQAIELLRQGKTEELWQMCCGYLKLDIEQFMEVQKRLLEEQLILLNNSPLGQRIMKGATPRNLDEFRRQVPLTSYSDYAPEFMEKREDILPDKDVFWVRTSGRTGDYPCKWVPMSYDYARELSIVLYGVGMLSCSRKWGDVSQIPDRVKLLYSVAPRPYISGTFADLLRLQTPLEYLPTLEESEKLTFEERIRLGFEEAMSQGLDYFFGLSLVLVMVGEKLRESSSNIDLFSLLKNPRALARILRGKFRAKLEKRELLPKDLWRLRGIIGSGVDSWVHKDKIYDYWGKYPLDIYSATEAGVVATQTWDYDGMTFTPNLNFLEFIPEDEKIKWEMDHSYQPRTLLLDEVKAGEVYEIVLTNFHGGAMVRYKIGDMVRITSLRNDNLGIDIPQMQFERRADDLISFMVIKLTEKQIWQAIEKSNVEYQDWTAYKRPGESLLHVLIEPKPSWQGNEADLLADLQNNLVDSGRSSYDESGIQEDWRQELGFQVELTLLPNGAFAGYLARKQAEGADPAHLKPRHINPSDDALSLLLAGTEEIIVVKKQPAARGNIKPEEEEKPDKVTI